MNFLVIFKPIPVPFLFNFSLYSGSTLSTNLSVILFKFSYFIPNPVSWIENLILSGISSS